MARKHEKEYTKGLPLSKKTTDGITEGELIEIAKIEIDAPPKAKNSINKYIHSILQTRTISAITTIRAKNRYKIIKAQLLEQRSNEQNIATESNRPMTVNDDEIINTPRSREISNLGLLLEIESPNEADNEITSFCIKALSAGSCQNITFERIYESLGVEKFTNNKCDKRKSLTTTRVPKNSNQRKVLRYRATQQELKANFAKGAKKVIDGTIASEKSLPDNYPTATAFFNYFNEKLSGNTRKNNEQAISENQTWPTTYMPDMIQPFTVEEIYRSLKSCNRKKCAGPDHLKLENLYNCKLISLTNLFNTFFKLKSIPDCLKSNFTRVIAKVSTPTAVTDWRPLTIGSWLLRLYGKILSNRICSKVKLNKFQKAFMPIDGCTEHLFTLTNLIKMSHKEKRQRQFCFIDLEKAFDSIEHKSITNALKRFGIPEEYNDVINDIYKDSITKIILPDNTTTSEIPINIGVKQGCTLSPILFNLVIDELIEELKMSSMGICIENNKTPALAFADDLVLLSENIHEMRSMLRKVEHFLKKHHLNANVNKCGLINMRRSPRKNLMILADNTLKLNNIKLPPIYANETIKYLGLRIDGKGNTKSNQLSDNVTTWLNNINKSSCKPEQKVRIIREFVIPKLIFSLRNVDYNYVEIRKLDSLIKKTTRKILHLPQNSPAVLIELGCKYGGLGIANLSELHSGLRLKVYNQMNSNKDIVIRTLANQHHCMTNITRHVKRLNLPDEEINIKQYLINRKIQHLKEYKISAKELLSTVNSDLNLGNIVRGTSKVKGGAYVNVTNFIHCTTRTKINLTRGRPEEDKKCRNCKRNNEDNAHVLAGCPMIKGIVTTRHNNIVKEIQNDLKTKGATVYSEKLTYVNGIGYKPDMLIVKDNKLYVAEVSIPYCQSREYLKKRHEEKMNKYNNHDYLCKINGEINNNIGQPQVCAIIIGARGSIYKETLEDIYKIGLNRGNARKYQELACIMSDKIWRAFLNRRWIKGNQKVP